MIAGCAARIELAALTREQTEWLFGSTFGKVPHLALLADRIHKIALGNPRASLTLAQHLIDTRAIRYEDGHWALPAELEARDLPKSAAEALAARIDALPELARQLAQTQALLTRALRREDYAALVPARSPRELDKALDVGALCFIGTQRRDLGLLAGLQDLLEPFAPLSPMLFAFWQNAIAIDEAYRQARPLTAQRRWIDIHERLQQTEVDSGRYKEIALHGIALAIAQIAASRGADAAFTWAARLGDKPHQRVNALRVRSDAHRMQNDPEAAERLRREAELLALHASSVQLLNNTIPNAALPHVLCRDLAGVKRVIDRMQPLAARHPGWVVELQLATGHFELLRGDLAAAKRAFEQCRALSSPERSERAASLDLWIQACAGLVATLAQQDRPEAAVQLGEQSLALAATLGIEVQWHQAAVALALAEAKLARFERASARLDAGLRRPAGARAARLGTVVRGLRHGARTPVSGERQRRARARCEPTRDVAGSRNDAACAGLLRTSDRRSGHQRGVHARHTRALAARSGRVHRRARRGASRADADL